MQTGSEAERSDRVRFEHKQAKATWMLVE